MRKHRLRITRIAGKDLDDLYTEGFLNWGEKKADRYYDGLLTHLDRICENPLRYRTVDEIRIGYRRSVYERHSIYYVIDNDTVEIRAVVKRQDISGRL